MARLTHPSLANTEHRPWPLPRGPWQWTQSWSRLLFAHWRVPPGVVQSLLPPGLTVDLYHGEAWVAVVPFELDVRRRWSPPFPTATRFPEINVRTYVTDGRRRGVWFFSLDAQSRLAVWGARQFFYLPYYYARMAATGDEHAVHYRSQREQGDAAFRAQYGPAGDVFYAVPGSREHFLTERYALYASRNDGSLYQAVVHHAPWPLQTAWADIALNTMAGPPGIELSGEPLLHYASRLDVAVWPLRRVGGVERVPALVEPCPGVSG